MRPDRGAILLGSAETWQERARAAQLSDAVLARLLNRGEDYVRTALRGSPVPHRVTHAIELWERLSPAQRRELLDALGIPRRLSLPRQ